MIESWRVKHQIDNSLHTDPDDILFLPIYYDPREADPLGYAPPRSKVATW